MVRHSHEGIGIVSAQQKTPSLARVEKTTFAGRDAWIKRPEAERSTFFSGLHRVLARALPKVLRPTNAAGGMAALQGEAARLRGFHAAGLPVPEVLEETGEHIVLADCGVTLRNQLRATKDTAERARLIKAAQDVLVQVHHSGRAHGRPFVKDMTVSADGGQICLLDLEEDPCAHMAVADAQARDVWLFLMSCAEFHDDPDAGLRDQLAVFIADLPDAIAPRLVALGRGLRPFRWIIGVTRTASLSRDVAGAYWSARALEGLAQSNVANTA
jgi:tRNA A-37 threonylcarbamoyl transferase component Bud32